MTEDGLAAELVLDDLVGVEDPRRKGVGSAVGGLVSEDEVFRLEPRGALGGALVERAGQRRDEVAQGQQPRLVDLRQRYRAAVEGIEVNVGEVDAVHRYVGAAEDAGPGRRRRGERRRLVARCRSARAGGAEHHEAAKEKRRPPHGAAPAAVV